MENPGTFRNIPEHSGTARNIPEHPGTSRNIPEHPGTSNNYHNYEKKMPKIKTWVCLRDHSVVPLHLCPIVADMSSDVM